MQAIRKATVDDIPLLRELTFKVWPQTYASILTREQIDYMLEMMYSPASLKKQMGEGAQFIFVYDDEIPVGFASYQQIDTTLFKLHKLYVLPTQQGKGTGRFLLDFIIADSKANGASTLQLQVNRHNKARNFYEKIGFSIIRECLFDIGNGYVMDDYIMEKKIS